VARFIRLDQRFCGTALYRGAVSRAFARRARVTNDIIRHHSDFGRYVLGEAAIGELGPIILVAVALSHEHNYLHQMLLSMVFLATAIEALFFARSLRSERLSRMIARWMGDSSVLPVRISILILLGFISLANKLGMEMVLGAYTAGMMRSQC
jgi:Kef-type K+ transport system membrane component KefB